MSESTALAKALAAQLGDDLDRILDTNSSPTPRFEVVETAPKSLELRQVAGLDSGHTKPLKPGHYQFGRGGTAGAGDDRTKPFFLLVDDSNVAWISSEVAGVRLDGRPVRELTPVDRAVIDAGSARFVVAPSRPPARRRGGGTRRTDIGPTEPLRQERLRIADYARTADAPVHPVRRRRLGLRSADRVQAPKSEPLIDKLLELRSQAVRHARAQFPDAGQLLQMASAGRDHMGDIGPADPGFATVPIAYGDLPWQPPIDRPDRIPGPLVVEVQQHSVLPSVPLSVDLRRGHLGIVGDRAACLAVARQIAVTLRVLSPTDTISFALLHPDQRAADWLWLDRMPNHPGGLPVLFLDGIGQVGEHDLRQTMIETGTGGAIIIDEQLHDMPSICANVLEIQPSGSASLLDFRRGATTTRIATPLGFSVETTDRIIGFL